MMNMMQVMLISTVSLCANMVIKFIVKHLIWACDKRLALVDEVLGVLPD